MQEKDFAAIAAYDWSLRKNDSTKATKLLILDLSELEGALCSFSETGEPRVLDHNSVQSKAEFFSRLAEKMGLSKEESYALWRAHRSDANKKLMAHLSNEERNYSVLQTASLSLDCKELLVLYEQDRTETESLLLSTGDMLRRNNIDPESIQILLSGQMASFQPSVFAVLSYFNPEPTLGDDRLVQFDTEEDPALFVQRGEKILHEQENSSFGHDVSMVCLANIGNESYRPERLVSLAEKTQLIKSMPDPLYKAELYLTDRSRLTLSVDGKRRTVSLRDRGIYEGLYRVGLRVLDKQAELCFQRSDDPSDVVYAPFAAQEA